MGKASIHAKLGWEQAVRTGKGGTVEDFLFRRQELTHEGEAPYGNDIMGRDMVRTGAAIERVDKRAGRRHPQGAANRRVN